MPLPPSVKKEKYIRTKHGILGSMGSGDTCINYIQTTFPIDDLRELGLVSEIPGSEQWPIRQLFQRDIDTERVTSEIMPYFEKSSKVRFFNPITIAVLPIDANGKLESGLKEQVESPSEEFADGSSYAIDGMYKVSYLNNDPSWAEIKWNPAKVRLIAIDGQHRLSALKRLHARFQRDPSDEALSSINFSQWQIPVIIVTVGHVGESDSAYSLLMKTRDIFVTINKQARPPSRCRTILLNDYSVTAICTQQLLDECRNDNELPLAVFDWREYRDPELPEYSTTLARVDEVEDWLIKYFVGQDTPESAGRIILTQEQKDALFVDDMSPPLDCSDDNQTREGIKDRFSETLLPALKFLLVGCKPYSDYVQYLRQQIKLANDDIGEHAWSRLIYGSDYAPATIEKDVSARKNEILKGCETKKAGMGRQYNNLIGLRAILSGFSGFAARYWDKKAIIPWLELAKLYTSGFNKAFSTGKLNENSAILRHLVFDHNDQIVNYKIDDVPDSFGLLCQFAVVSALGLKEELDSQDIETSLHKALTRGYKKELRPIIKEEMAGRSKDEQEAVINEQAAEKASVQLKKIIRSFKPE